MPGLIAENRNDRTSITIAQNALIIAILRNDVISFTARRDPKP